MRLGLLIAIAAFPTAAALAQAGDAPQAVPKPAALVADGIPPVPAELAARTRPYMEYRTAGFSGWNARDRSILVTTRFGNTSQVHRVAAPMGYRQQLTFEEEPVGASWSPAGDVLVARKDIGGNEFYQLYRLEDGRLTLLTDGESRNNFGAWSEDGRLIGYSSTRRNGRDSDLYVMDPRDPSTDRMVAAVEGGGWQIADFTPDNRRAIVFNYIQITNSDLYMLDLASGAMTPIGDISRDIAFGGAEFAPDGTLWVTSDEGSEFQRLGTLDPGTGAFDRAGSVPHAGGEQHKPPGDRPYEPFRVGAGHGEARLAEADPAGHACRVARLVRRRDVVGGADPACPVKVVHVIAVPAQSHRPCVTDARRSAVSRRDRMRAVGPEGTTEVLERRLECLYHCLDRAVPDLEQ